MGNSQSQQPKEVEDEQKIAACSGPAEKGRVRIMLCKGNPRNTPMPKIPPRNRQIEQYNWAKLAELQKSALYTPRNSGELEEAPAVPPNSLEEPSYLCDCSCHATTIENDMQSYTEESDLNATLNNQQEIRPGEGPTAAQHEESYSNLSAYCISSDSSTSESEIASFNCPPAPNNTFDNEWHTKDCECIKCQLSFKLEHLRSLEQDKTKKTVIYRPNDSTEIEGPTTYKNEEASPSGCARCSSVRQQAGLEVYGFSADSEREYDHCEHPYHHQTKTPGSSGSTGLLAQAEERGSDAHDHYRSWLPHMKKSRKKKFQQLDAQRNAPNVRGGCSDETVQAIAPGCSSNFFGIAPRVNYANKERGSASVDGLRYDFQRAGCFDPAAQVPSDMFDARDSPMPQQFPSNNFGNTEEGQFYAHPRASAFVLNRFTRKMECAKCTCVPRSAGSHQRLLKTLGVNIVPGNTAPFEDVYVSENTFH